MVWYKGNKVGINAMPSLPCWGLSSSTWLASLLLRFIQWSRAKGLVLAVGLKGRIGSS